MVTKNKKKIALAENVAVQNEENQGNKIQLVAQGSSGTELFSGYYSEEYLQALRGSKAADAYDKMRRSDAKIKMVLSAVKNPIKRATWAIKPADDSEEQKKIAELIRHILFNDMEKPFSEFLSEALSVVDFGHSIFEVTHKAVLNHKKFGNYNGIRSLGFRSQRTIERWLLDENGTIQGIEQNSYGDVGKSDTIQGDFVLVFSLDKEGDNYEGISGLRPCFGPWSRKQTYLKLMAIGIEKSAIPTPVATVPENKENSEQFLNMIEVLKAYTSHQSNYITMPTGWTVTFLQNPFDGEKLKGAIEFENREIVFAFLANFLELGMTGGGGSYALSFDLSDFFLGGIEHIAQIIADQINLKLIPQLVQLNFGPQETYPKLAFAGISDKIGEEFANMITALVNAKVLTPDSKLESELRRRMGLPEKPVEPVAAAQTLAEKKRILLAETPKQQIKDATDPLKELMQKHLSLINEGLVNKVLKQYETANSTNEINAVKEDLTPSIAPYKADLEREFAKIALASYKQALKELPTSLRKQFSEGIQLAEIDQLPEKVRKRVKALADLTAETQVADLEKAVKFQYASSLDSTDSADLLKKDMLAAGSKFIDGPAIISGAPTLSADLTNAGRMALFFEAEDEIESYTFVNGDPKTPICQDLNGTTFEANDPEALRYFPPLHHNAVIRGTLILTNEGEKPIETLQVGELVKTHTGKWQPITEVMDRFEDKEFFEITLDDGKKINITAEHPVLTDRGWLRVDELLLTDNIKTIEDLPNA